jgi:carbon storage regulator
VDTSRPLGVIIKEVATVLVLSRKSGEKFQVGTDITITVLEIQGHRVRIGIEAPRQLSVLRAELSDARPMTEASLHPDVIG